MSDNTKNRVLKLALEKHGVRPIAKILKLHPSTVSRHLKYWVRSGYLVRSSPLGAVAAFEPGPNLPKQVLHRVLHDATPLAPEKTAPTVGCGLPLDDFDIMPTIGGEPQEGFIPMRIHALGHRFYLQRSEGEFNGPTKQIPWTEETICSGVPTHILIIPVNGYDIKDERRIKIVYREGANSQNVEIWTPEVIITNPLALQEFEGWAAARAQRVANWLSRHYGFKFGLMVLCQNLHFAAAVPKEVARAAKEIGLKTPDLWYDNSRGRGDLETDEKRMATTLMTLPNRVAQLEGGIIPTLERLVDTQNQLVESHTLLLQYLQRLLGPDKAVPEQPSDTDPGGMFG